MTMASKKTLVSDLISTVTSVPPNYIRPTSERPNLHENPNVDDHSIPLIDLQGLFGPNRSNIINQIAQACQNYGFFQVKNHGVSEEVVKKMLHVSREFFHLPESERMKIYSDDPLKATRLSTSFNIKTENVANWRDYLRLQCYPLEDYIHDWPTIPQSFRQDVGEYSRNVRELALKLLQAISESLNLRTNYMNEALGKHGQHMAINFYPPCPQPDLTLGLPAHSDPNAITILLQDDVCGLQVVKDGKWISVKHIPDTFIVNIGDQMQVLSNGRYKSVLHRALVNKEKERISIPTFYCPSMDAEIGPAEQLVDDDHPAIYRSFTYNEYYKVFWNHGLATETCLDKFKVQI